MGVGTFVGSGVYVGVERSLGTNKSLGIGVSVGNCVAVSVDTELSELHAESKMIQKMIVIKILSRILKFLFSGSQPPNAKNYPPSDDNLKAKSVYWCNTPPITYIT